VLSWPPAERFLETRGQGPLELWREGSVVSVQDLITWLSAISSLAVILGVAFVVLQLRQNAGLLEATLRQQRSDVTLGLIERVTDESFPRRRHHMYETLRRFKETGWKGAFESLDDFEVRDFAQIYELIGVMSTQGLIDSDVIAEVLQFTVVRDWEAFEPHARFLAEQYHADYYPFTHFRALAVGTKQRLPHTVLPRSNEWRLREPADRDR
jgi:hypothetical protein